MRRQPSIDLGMVRDTLLYIESDLQHAPEYAKLALAIRFALNQIEELSQEPPAPGTAHAAAARFIPAGL